MIELLGKFCRFMLKKFKPIFDVLFFVIVCLIPIINILFLWEMIEDYAREERKIFKKGLKSDDEFAGYIALGLLVNGAYYFHALRYLFFT